MEINNTFNQLGFQIVKNIINDETVNLLTHQFKMFRDVHYITNGISKENTGYFRDRMCKNSFTKGKLLIFEALQVMLQDKLELVTGKKLLPTYSYGRIYYEGSDLPLHKDRKACEYSATLCLENDSTNWPIFIKDFYGKEHCINQNPGDILVYRGIDLAHWRNSFQGNQHIQCFLHYVDAEGPYKDQIFDGRSALGIPIVD
jgi:hypothetical protein